MARARDREGLFLKGSPLLTFRGKSPKVVGLFLVLTLGYFYCSLQRISSGVLLPHIGKSMGFSAALVGFLSSLFFYSYGFTQNIWGTVSDRTGPVKSCAVGMGITAVGSVLPLVSPAPLYIGLSRFLCGLGLASYFTEIYIYAALAFPEDEYPSWAAFVQTVGNLGTIAAVAPLGILMDSFGYSAVFMIFTAWALCSFLALWFFRGTDIRLNKAPMAESRGAREIFVQTSRDIWYGCRLMASEGSLRLIGCSLSIVIGAVVTIQGLWGVSWMSVSSGVPVETARFWTTSISVGMMTGAVPGSIVARTAKSVRRGMLSILAPLTLAWAAYMISAATHLPPHVMGAVGFVIGVASVSCMVFSLSAIRSLVPVSRAGLVIGTAQMLIYIMVVILQWGSGLVINMFPGEEAGTYLNTGFLTAFSFVALLICLSLLMVWRMPDIPKNAG
jgi:MFS family permease